MKRKFAIVTGATSKVIDELINLLIGSDYYVVAVSRYDQKSEVREHVKWVKCDLTIANQDFSYLKNADVLFHAAAISNAYSLNEYLHANYQSTINLVDASNKQGVKKIVYISSILAGYQYGNYGISKIKSEEYIKIKMNDWLIIRPSQLYGYSKTSPIDKLIATVKNKSVVFCPMGDKKAIYPLYFHELAHPIFEMSIVKNETQIVRFISGPVSFNYKGLVKEIASVLNKSLLIVPIPKIFIQLTYILIRTFRIKIGIYPDQLYRFYHNNTTVEIETGKSISINDYLKERE